MWRPARRGGVGLPLSLSLWQFVVGRQIDACRIKCAVGSAVNDRDDGLRVGAGERAGGQDVVVLYINDDEAGGRGGWRKRAGHRGRITLPLCF